MQRTFVSLSHFASIAAVHDVSTRIARLIYVLRDKNQDKGWHMTDDEQAAKTAEWERIPTQDEIDAALEDARYPGLLMIKTDRPYEDGWPGSWLGGDANLPPEIEWPCFTISVEEEVEDEDGEIYDDFVEKKIPKHLLAQINLASLPRINGLEDIPEHGTLFFFFEPNAASFYALNRKTLAMNCVLYTPDDVSEYPLRTRPQIPYPDLSDDNSRDFAKRIEPYVRRPFEFYHHDGYRQTIKPTTAVMDGRIIDACLKNEDGFRQQLSHRHFTKTRRGTSQEIEDAQAYFAANPENAYYFQMHHMFGGRFQEEPEGDLVRLMAIQADRDLGFEYNNEWIVFWIEKEHLKARQFEKAFITQERS